MINMQINRLKMIAAIDPGLTIDSGEDSDELDVDYDSDCDCKF